MNISALIMLFVVGAIVWGGFVFALLVGMRKEKEKEEN